MQDDALKPHMSEAEIALLAKYIPKGGNILEFGCGGSTKFFFENGAAFVASVESDMAWIDTLAQNSTVRKALGEKRWRILPANIGPVGEWGTPADPNPSLLWLNYHEKCWQRIDAGAVDLALIDGRFRVACFCQTLLRCTNPDLVLVMHDFWNRPQYHCILHFCTVLDQVDTLAVFRKKNPLEKPLLEQLLHAHTFNFF